MFKISRYLPLASAVAALKRKISVCKESEEKLRLADTVFRTASEAILVTDSDNRIVAVNPSFTKITGYKEEEILGRNPNILGSARQDAEFYRRMWESLTKNGEWQGEIWNRRKNGEVFPAWLSISAIRGDDGEIHQYVGIFVDITKHKENEETIQRQANFDALTGLPNRNLFMDRLALALARGRRKSSELAVMFIDLDRFNKINDTLGPSVGDQLLQETARRLLSCVRESDTVARFGGDEFAIILPDLNRVVDAEVVARKFMKALSQPFMIQDTEVFISGSIGITLAPSDGDDAETMVKNADSAMYRAMESGRNTYRFFTAEINTEVLEHMKLENDLHRALERGEFVLHYQPIVNPRSRQVMDAEALIRWNHPERGFMAPDRFIPLTEETGLIVPIGEWIFRTVCEQVKAWSLAGLPPLRVAVNLSSRQCREAGFGKMIERILEETGVNPARLALEITESIFFDYTDVEAMNSLHELRKKGIKLSLDDFGTGYSSLSYLKRFPVDVVKIDRSFVKDVVSDTEDRALVEAIIAMANSLKTEVVGEGVETEMQMAFLLSRKCDFLQGYYFSKPLPVAEFETFMLQHYPAPILASA